MVPEPAARLRPRFANWILIPVVALALAGCKSAQVAQPLTGTLAGNDPSAQLEFWHTLATRPVTSNDEAFHGILLFADGQDPAGDYARRVEAMKQRRMLPAKFNQPAERAVERGTLAVAICRILEVKGGVMMRLTNAAPRYAVRELEFLNVYPTSSPNQTFSGAEFLGIVGRVEDYQRGNPNNVPASVLPAEMGGASAPSSIGR